MLINHFKNFIKLLYLYNIQDDLKVSRGGLMTAMYVQYFVPKKSFNSNFIPTNVIIKCLAGVPIAWTLLMMFLFVSSWPRNLIQPLDVWFCLLIIIVIILHVANSKCVLVIWFIICYVSPNTNSYIQLICVAILAINCTSSKSNNCVDKGY